MKARGHILIKISSVIFILYGAASLLALLLALLNPERAAEYGFDERLTSVFPILSVAFAVLLPLLFLAAGLLGMLRADFPNRMGLGFALGIVILLIAAGDVLDLAYSGKVSNIAEICTCILVLLVPALYVVGAWRNWKQPKSSETKAAEKEPEKE